MTKQIVTRHQDNPILTKNDNVYNVVFTCGAVPEDDGTIKLYWGGADKVICAGTAVIDELMELCLVDSRDPI